MFDEFRPIDTDTHLTEPADLWTSRISGKWGDAVPHIKHVDGKDYWFIRDQLILAPAWVTMAGFDGAVPDGPSGFSDIPASSYDSHARLAYMDAEGIHAQVLFPNVGGFGSGGFLRLKEPQLMLECVRAYNDFLIEWCSADKSRLLPAAAIPFWDLRECVKEVERAAKIGHKTILACTLPQDFDQPRLAHPHWTPFWEAIQDTGLPVSFHIGGGAVSSDIVDPSQMGVRAHIAGEATKLFMGNVNCLVELLFGGVCHRFPKLNLFSVESGIGWIPSFLELCDWQFMNGGVRLDHPEYDLLPSEYFKRQIYASFWFETELGGIETAIQRFPDNIMWETDFPHPTSQSVGFTKGWGQHPRDYAGKNLSFLGQDRLQKILHGNAARLFHLS
jgi:predicted TIM-barrel fold metal-dependent hydrolase